MTATITIDFETKSYADLTKVGAWAYSEDPTTDVICICWGIDDHPIQSWWPGKYKNNDIPYDLHQAIAAADLFEAHNASFEISIWINVLAKRYGWPTPELIQWRDTMAVACYYALPAALDGLARVLGFEGKDPEGARLITKYSKLYLKTAQEVIPLEDFAKFVAYCNHDVRMEQSISDYLGDLPERELLNFLFDLGVNMRGIALDREGIAVASRIVTQRSLMLTGEFIKLTGLNPTQDKKLKVWFKDQGLELENMQAAYLEELLDGEELPTGPTRRALEIRLNINKASTKKLDAMLRQRGTDGRARFQTRYHGAGTGRSTGSGFQPLNLNRGMEGVSPEQLVRDIMYGDAAWLDCLYGDAMDAVAKASRHWIIAKPGNKIMAGDFTSIEAVLLACIAGEQWKVDAFVRGDKIYELMGDKIHGLAPGTVTKASHPAERQDGKTGELAFGYQGALGAWLKFDSSGRHTDQRIIEICQAWRAEHPAIVDFWYGLDATAMAAMADPSQTHYYRDIGFERVDKWLTMILPNGKRLWYWDPQVKWVMPHWHLMQQRDECKDGTCDCRPQPRVSYMAQKLGQWMRVYTYGGKETENAIQGASRELLYPAARRLQENGYDVVLTVYDEVVCEVPENFGSIEEFNMIMVNTSDNDMAWARDIPINASVWEGARFKK